MKKRGLFLAVLFAALVPFVASCDKGTESEKEVDMVASDYRNIMLGLKEAGQNVKNVDAYEETYIYSSEAGDVYQITKMKKKIYENKYSIGTGTSSYSQIGFSLEDFAVMEQVYRQGQTAYLIHDGSDSGYGDFSYKMTRNASALDELLYSGVREDDITQLKEVAASDDLTGLRGAKKGSKYTFAFNESRDLGQGYTYEKSLKITVEKKGLDYNLLSYTHFEMQKDNHGDDVLHLDFKYTYTNKSNGNFDQLDSLLNPDDYYEYYPDLEPDAIDVEGNMSDAELASYVNKTGEKTAAATGRKSKTELTYHQGSLPGLVVTTKEDLKRYSGDEYGENGILYGTGTYTEALSGYSYEVTYTTQYGNVEATFDGVFGAYRYQIFDYDEEDEYSTDHIASDKKLTSMDTPVTFEDTMIQFYASCIGKNYTNVNYVGVKDEEAGTVTLYMNLAFSQEDEDGYGVKQGFVVVYDIETGNVISLQYTEQYFLDTNLGENAYYTYVETNTYSYEDASSFAPITPYDPSNFSAEA